MSQNKDKITLTTHPPLPSTSNHQVQYEGSSPTPSNMNSHRHILTSPQFSALITAILAAAVASTEAKKLSHSQATAKLRAAGIKWTSSGGCSDRNTATCTSFTQVREETINGAITLKRACGCDVTITGGTETGHASGTYSHWNGYKLDMRKASGLNGYITRTFTRISNRSDGAKRYKANSGNIYAVSLESPPLSTFDGDKWGTR